MNFSQIIQDIENELHLVYMPGAIHYIDGHYDNAWSKAIDRFDAALAKRNLEISKLEGAIYRETILKLIAIYKSYKRGNKASEFLKSLKK